MNGPTNRESEVDGRANTWAYTVGKS